MATIYVFRMTGMIRSITYGYNSCEAWLPPPCNRGEEWHLKVCLIVMHTGPRRGAGSEELLSGPSRFLLYNLIWTFSDISIASNTADFLLTYQSVFLGLLTCLSSQQNLPLPLHTCGHPIASRMLSLPFLSLQRAVLTGDLLASHQLTPKRKCKMPK